MAGDLLLSAIIPTRDRPDKLAALLRGLARQTVGAGAFEVLISDDGSREPVEPAVRALDLPFACEVARGEPAGPAAARNRVIGRARAPLLLILNDDVLPEPDLLEQHLAAHERLAGRGPHSVLGTFWFTDDVRRERLSRILEDAGLYGNRWWPAEREVGYWCFWTPNLSVARAAVEEAGGFDERFREAMVEDIDLGLRLERAGVRCFYSRKPHALHDHALDLPGWMRRNARIGHNRYLMFEKYGEPSLLSDRDPQSWPDPGFVAAGAARLARQGGPIEEVRALAARLVRGDGVPATIPLTGQHFTDPDAALEACLSLLCRYDYSLGLLEAAEKGARHHSPARMAEKRCQAPFSGERVAVTSGEGFVVAFDRAVAGARDEFLLVHDPRALVTDAQAAALAAHLERHPKAAVVAPLVGYVQPEPDQPLSTEDRAARVALLETIDAERAAARAGVSQAVPEVLSACLLVRRAAVLQAGALHPRYRQAPYAIRDLGLKLQTIGLEIRVAHDVLVPLDLHRDLLADRFDRAAVAHDYELFLSRWVRSAR